MRGRGVHRSRAGDRLKKSVGFRNLAVHNYDVLDWQIAFAIATRHLEDFRAFAKAVAALL